MDRLSNSISGTMNEIGEGLGIKKAIKGLENWVTSEFVGNKETVEDVTVVKELRADFRKNELSKYENVMFGELAKILGTDSDVVNVLGTYSESGARALIKEKAGSTIDLETTNEFIRRLRPKMRGEVKKEIEAQKAFAKRVSGVMSKATFAELVKEGKIGEADLVTREGKIFDSRLNKDRDMTEEELSAEDMRRGEMKGAVLGWDAEILKSIDYHNIQRDRAWRQYDFAGTAGNFVLETGDRFGYGIAKAAVFLTNVFGAGWMSQADFGDKQKQTGIVNRAITAAEKALAPITTANNQLDKIRSQMYEMGAKAGISAGMINDPQLVMQSMMGDAIATGMTQLIDNTAVLKRGMVAVDGGNGSQALQVVHVDKQKDW